MLLNVGLRTDIVAHYSRWLLNRIEAGFVYSRNPLFPNKVTEYSLAPNKIDAMLFCSKNYGPLLPDLHKITEQYRTLFHFTINYYDTDFEPHTPSLFNRLEQLRELSALVGRGRVFWRYDPILLTKKYSVRFHFEAFRMLTERIAPYVAGCVTNFVEMNMALHHGLDVELLTPANKRNLMSGIGEIAREFQMPIRICGRGEDYSEFGVARGGCVTVADIDHVNGCRFRDVHAIGNKRGCACIQSRDIGWYDSCPSYCVYCNANRNMSAVPGNVMKHNPNSPILIGELQPTDILHKSPQETMLYDVGGQMTLFDF